jgi:hypothetical protein
MNTFAGSNFMTAFNAWYYSFSPTVAQYESQHPVVQSAARVALYPLMGLLRLSESTFAAFGPASEIGALTAGLLAGFLIGLAYLALPFLCIFWPLRKRITRTLGRMITVTACTLVVLVLGFVMAEILMLPVLMMISSAGLVLTALISGSLIPVLLVIELRRTH